MATVFILFILLFLSGMGLASLGRSSKKPDVVVNSEPLPPQVLAKVEAVATGEAVPTNNLTTNQIETSSSLRYPPLTDQQQRLARLYINSLHSNYDEVKQITWYEPSRDSLQSDVYLYAGVTPHGPILRLVLHYYGSDWIFFEKVLVRADSDLVTIVPDAEINRENGDEHVWETSDELAENHIAAIEKIITSTNCILRFEGPHHTSDIDVGPDLKMSMSRVLLVYLYLGGNFDRDSK